MQGLKLLPFLELPSGKRVPKRNKTKLERELKNFPFVDFIISLCNIDKSSELLDRTVNILYDSQVSENER